jgi:hypothetical protein
MEAFVRVSLMKHSDINKLLSKKQFGFLKGQSTVTQLFMRLGKWTECLDFGGKMDAIHTNLETDFDEVHIELIGKLESYRADKEITSRIAAFYKNRKQRVKIDGFYSFWIMVFSGVPQGSILGPILIITFI